MQEWRDFVQQIALLISSVVGYLTAFSAFQKQKHDTSKEDKEELRQDLELYRERWKDAERGYEDLDKENESLKEENEKLKKQIDLLKKRGNYNARPKRRPKTKHDDN